MRWVIENRWIIDENKENVILDKINGEINLDNGLNFKRAWKFILGLAKAKLQNKNGLYTYREILHDVMGIRVDSVKSEWENNYETFKKTLQKSKKTLSNDLFKNQQGEGYVLNAEVKRVFNKTPYYEFLWKRHVKGARLINRTVHRDIIEYFVLPHLKNNTEALNAIFDENKYLFIKAGSGFGKTTFLDMIVLCLTYNDLIVSDLDNTTKNKIINYKEAYEKIKIEILGDKSMFPVFIHAKEANSESYENLLELAEGKKNLEYFDCMVDEAHKNGELLILIDSIDELEWEKIEAFIKAINKLKTDYEKSQIVLTSRFVEKISELNDFNDLELDSLKYDDILKIAGSILNYNEVEDFKNKTLTNTYILSLCKNPFNLMIILDNIRESLTELLGKICDSIIKVRWSNYTKPIRDDDLKLLLGYLAFEIIGNKYKNKSVTSTQITNAFINAKGNLEEYEFTINVNENEIKEFLTIISSQSGILNVKNNYSEFYEFQDELIMSWLASNYLYEILCASDKLKDETDSALGWYNAGFVNELILSICGNIKLSEDLVNTLIMALIKISEDSKGGSIGILFYLLFKHILSLDTNEKNVIESGFKKIKNKVFGTSDVIEDNNKKLIENY